MKDKVFLDTNIFVYMQSATELEKRKISLNAVDKYDCYVSTQVLNEVCNVLLRKLKMRINEVRAILTAIRSNCTIAIISYETVTRALDLTNRYGFSYYDSLILSSALESGCKRIFTEDLSDGQIVDNNTLCIENIFKDS